MTLNDYITARIKNTYPELFTIILDRLRETYYSLLRIPII